MFTLCAKIQVPQAHGIIMTGGQKQIIFRTDDQAADSN
jgi:hypothetical protein